MINRCLIIDTETTGLTPQTAKLIEFGAVLYSVKNQTTLVQYSTLLPCDQNPLVKVNRISDAALAEIEPGWYADTLVDRLRASADVIVAHNAEFDRQWLGGAWRDVQTAKPWLCTMTDFDWPQQNKPGDSLVNLALAHGIGVASSHRALSDCQLIAALFDRMTDLQAMFMRAMRPKFLYEAQVSYDDREKAKAMGFRWEPEKTGKRWVRRMAEEDAFALPFLTRRCE